MDKRKTLLQELVKDELESDSVINDGRIDVEGVGSDIVLTGVLDNEADRVLAEEDTRRVEGVTSVTNELGVGADAA
jgi:osmotically-inducible protein OsmY